MLIKNAKIFIGKRFVSGDLRFSDKIEAIGTLEGDADIDADGNYIIPGLVDIHTHGAIGEDFSDAKPDGLEKLSEFYADHGVTSFLATTMALDKSALNKAMHCVRGFRRTDGAKCMGVNLEGPFLSYAKRGAHAPENLHAPDIDMFSELNEASGKRIKLVTIAPELKGALDFIKEAKNICVVSVGHTAADYETAMAAFEAGASHLTHLYNAMTSFTHRAPGVIGAAFDSGANVELICDGHHVHQSAIRMAYGLFGDRISLISDSLRCAGMKDGNYELTGKQVVLRGGVATLLDGTLAGSSISLIEALSNYAKFGMPLESAVYAASTAPAEAARLDVGRIECGLPADLVMLTPDLSLAAVFIDGKRRSPAGRT